MTTPTLTPEKIQRLADHATRTTDKDATLRAALYRLRVLLQGDLAAGDLKRAAVILAAVDPVEAGKKATKARATLRSLVGQHWPKRRQAPAFILGYRGKEAPQAS